MSSTNHLIMGLGLDLRYCQIDARVLYEKIREETANLIVGNLPPSRWNELALGLWEATIEETFKFAPEGVRFDTRHYDWNLFRKNLLNDDADDIIHDGKVYLFNQLICLIPKTAFEYRCGYKLMPNMNVLVGIDERDFLVPRDEPPIEELYFED